MAIATWGDFKVDLDQVVGRGGTSTVYSARQVSLDRACVVKVLDLNSNLPTERDEMLTRFQNEARSIGRVRDPRIVQVFQAGQNDRRFWIAMEWVNGKTLADRLEAGERFSPQRIAEIGIEIAKALNAALGQERLIHRDIKPANVFVLDSGDVKISDFGLAKVVDATGERLTRTGFIMGTPTYLAPEIIGGGSADHRADMYALGCVLYEMACELPPFDGAGYAELLYKHVNQNPTPPRKLNPDIPESLEAIILRCLAKKPDERYATYEQLMEGLANLVAPGQARPYPVWRLVAGIVALAVAAGVLAVVIKSRPAAPRTDEPSVAVRMPDPKPKTDRADTSKVQADEPPRRTKIEPTGDTTPKNVRTFRSELEGILPPLVTLERIRTVENFVTLVDAVDRLEEFIRRLPETEDRNAFQAIIRKYIARGQARHIEASALVREALEGIEREDATKAGLLQRAWIPGADRLAREIRALHNLKQGKLVELMEQDPETISGAKAIRRMIEKFKGDVVPAGKKWEPHSNTDPEVDCDIEEYPLRVRSDTDAGLRCPSCGTSRGFEIELVLEAGSDGWAALQLSPRGVSQPVMLRIKTHEATVELQTARGKFERLGCAIPCRADQLVRVHVLRVETHVAVFVEGRLAHFAKLDLSDDVLLAVGKAQVKIISLHVAQ